MKLQILSFMLSVATVLTACSGGSNDTPEEAVAAYFDAVDKRDCSEMAALFLSDNQSEIEASCKGWSDENHEKMVEVFSQGWTIRNIQLKEQEGARKTNGHDCRVVVGFSVGYASSFYLDNVNGDWKIADVD